MTVYDALSRYALGATNQVADRVVFPTTQPFSVHVVREGDTLESIASRHLGNPTRYWEIADINPQIKFPLDIDVGTVLRLPL